MSLLAPKVSAEASEAKIASIQGSLSSVNAKIFDLVIAHLTDVVATKGERRVALVRGKGNTGGQ